MTDLLVNRELAKSKIIEQIKRGKALIDGSYSSLEEFGSQYTKWYDFTKLVITKFFAGEELLEEFKGAHAGLIMVAQKLSPSEKLVRRKRTLHLKIDKLESILERIDLMDERNARETPIKASATQLKRKVFIVHGHDEAAKQSTARILENHN